MGSMAKAEMAEYGLFCPRAASFTGSTWTSEKPADTAQRAKGTRSGISPRPQPEAERMAERGTRTPDSRMGAGLVAREGSGYPGDLVARTPVPRKIRAHAHRPHAPGERPDGAARLARRPVPDGCAGH